MKIRFASPAFDINQALNLKANYSIECYKLKFTPVELSAIMCGNVEIIQILEQSQIQPNAARCNHREIFDYLIEQFPEHISNCSLSKLLF